MIDQCAFLFKTNSKNGDSIVTVQRTFCGRFRLGRNDPVFQLLKIN